MDLQIPVMGGLEACRAIRKNDARGRHIPIIAVTAHAMESDRVLCLEAGMDGFVSKPIRIEALVSELERLIYGAPAAADPETAARSQTDFTRAAG